MPVKKAKKPTKAKLMSECRDLWSLCVRARDKTCRLCGADSKLTAHHLRSVSNSSTVLDLENGLTICWPEHSRQKWNPEAFQDKIIDCIGQAEYDRLKVKSQVIFKWDVATLLLEKQVLKDALKRFQEGDCSAS